MTHLRGADVNLRKAVNKSLQPNVRKALEDGADINRNLDGNGNTALHIASSKGNFGIVKYLLENGADVHLKNIDDESPVDLALKGHHKRVFLELCKHDPENDLCGLLKEGTHLPENIRNRLGNIPDNVINTIRNKYLPLKVNENYRTRRVRNYPRHLPWGLRAQLGWRGRMGLVGGTRRRKRIE